MRPDVALEPVAPGHVAELHRIRRTPEVLRRWGDIEAGWPFDDEDSVGFAVLVGGGVRGFVQYSEEPTPMYRHAGIDIFLDPAVHGAGVGRTAVYLTARRLVDERHHHRLVIDPAADNTAAIRCYEAVGFRVVGVLREYERGPDGSWHDGLLMDLLARELREP
jgi:RimJ/RimL family protein N-acetyltransferase